MPEDRDQLFERALARRLRREGAAASSCLDPETLAAYHERMLSAEELRSAKSHIISCARCQQVLALLEATEEVGELQHEAIEEVPSASVNRLVPASREAGRGTATVPGESAETAVSFKKVGAIAIRKSSLLRWVAPAGAIAAALLIWIGVREFGMRSMSPVPSAQVAKNGPQPPANSETEAPDEFALPKELEKQKSESAPADRLDYAASDRLNDSRASARAVPGPQPSLRDQKKDSVADEEPEQRAKKRPQGYDLSARNRPTAGSGPSAAAAQAQANNAVQRGDQRAAGGALQMLETTPPADLDRVQVQSPPARSGILTGAELAPQPPPPSRAREPNPSPAGAGFSEITGTAEASKMANFKTALSKNSLDVRISSPGGKKIWSVGPGGRIFHSSDSGRTWVPQVSGVVANLLGGSAPSDGVCWIAGSGGTLLRTGDSGHHWETISAPIAGDLGGVEATDDEHAFIWDAPKRLRYETSDGGKTWKRSANE